MGPGLDDGRLVFSFAHDLRTYLRTILTRVQLVQKDGESYLPEEARQFLQEAATAAVDMGALLNSMVDYCSVEPRPGEMPLGLLLQGALMERKAAFAAVGAETRIENPLDHPVPVALQGVLKELLTNACKFRDTSRPLRVVLSASMSDGHIELAVTDNGTGIPGSYFEKLFTPFQRFHAKGEYPGHGLGLATCRRTVATFGGAMSAAPAADNGLVVRVTIPSTTV